jgi:polysaccharide deacetylase 2 family uncharacterized protein YibQ
VSAHRPARRQGPAARIVADRSGGAGLIATLVMSVAGLAFGTLGGYLGERADPGAASRAYAARLDLRDAPPIGASPAFDGREALLARVLTGQAPERLAPPRATDLRPKIIVIFDDVGLDDAALSRLMRLPGPLTLSFLPYGTGVQAKADAARARGDGVMLHLPMEPMGSADPGPLSLRTGMSASDFLETLELNLGSFSGYVGVNNHMGSRLTQDEAAMKTVLAALDARGLFFVDSLTTGRSAAARAGAAVGATVYARDVFIDAEGDAKSIARALGLVERIAAQTGFAVAIAHPRPATLDVLGPWLTSAPMRGFELATVEALGPLSSGWVPPAAVAYRE